MDSKILSADSNFILAVLIASFNRKESTVRAINSLVRAIPKNWNLKLFHVDDGSTDGTSMELQNLGLDIKTTLGSGNWFWAHSMFQAQNSIDTEFDALLFMNDDVTLYADSFSYLEKNLETHVHSILVGQFQDPYSGIGTYGGYKRLGRNPLKFEQIFSIDKVEVDTFNGNFVFIPKQVVDRVGLIDGDFAHAYADCDYGLRAKVLGVKSFLIPGFIGTCIRDEEIPQGNMLNSLKFHFSVKKSPIKSQIRYLSRHGGFEWPIYLFTPVIRIILRAFKRRVAKCLNFRNSLGKST